LLLAKLDAVVREFSPALSVLARGISSTVKGTFVRITPVSLKKHLQVFTSA
jgi:hypothetical protein